MNRKLRERMKRAQHNVICDPGNCEPPRPVVTAQEEDATHNRQEPNQFDQEDVLFKRLSEKVIEVVGKADST
jgi:hypothetical protein